MPGEALVVERQRPAFEQLAAAPAALAAVAEPRRGHAIDRVAMRTDDMQEIRHRALLPVCGECRRIAHFRQRGGAPTGCAPAVVMKASSNAAIGRALL